MATDLPPLVSRRQIRQFCDNSVVYMMMFEYNACEAGIPRGFSMIRRSSRRLWGAFALASTIVAGPAAATEGYFQPGYGAVQKAEAGAGVANPQDAMALSINPAGLVDLPTMVTGGVTAFMPYRGYEVNGPGFVAPGPFFGANSVQSTQNFFVLPNIAYSSPIDGDTSWGVAAYGNGGMNTTYPATFNGNPFPSCAIVGGVYCGGATGVDLKQMFISVGVAKRFGSISVGIAPIFAVQLFKADGLGFFGFPPIPGLTFSSDPTHLTNNGYSWSYGGGARLGVEWKITPSLRLGVAGQTPIFMTAFSKYAGLFAGNGQFNIPGNITAGIAFDALPTLTLMAEYKHIFYSGVPAIANPSAQIILPPIGPGRRLGQGDGPGFGWHDINVYTFGAEWRVTPNLALRAGYAHNDNPVRGLDVTFNILAPGIVTDHITGGFGYKFSENLNLDFALTYVPTKKVSGPEATPFGYNLLRTITLNMHQWEAALGMSYKFGAAPRPVVAKY